MPPEAKIFLAEDDPSIQTLGRIILQAESHHVVFTCTKSAVLDSKVMESAQKLNPNVAIVDGTLSWEVAQALKASFPGIKIVNADSDQSIHADATVRRTGSQDWLNDLARAVTRI